MEPVTHSQVKTLRDLLNREPIFNLKLLGTLGEEGGSCEGWWFDRWPDPRGALCRRRAFYALYAITEAGAEALLEGIDWSEEVAFSALPARFMPLLQKRGLSLSETPCSMYVTTQEDFRPCGKEKVSRILQPEDAPFVAANLGILAAICLTMGLRPEDAPLVSDNWTYGQDEAYILDRIQSGPTRGVRLDGQLVSWALTHPDGSIGMVHTLESHRGRYLARHVVSALTEELLRQGKTPWCFIVRENLASVRVFEALGFRQAGDHCWVRAAAKSPSTQEDEQGPPHC